RDLGWYRHARDALEHAARCAGLVRPRFVAHGAQRQQPHRQDLFRDLPGARRLLDRCAAQGHGDIELSMVSAERASDGRSAPRTRLWLRGLLAGPLALLTACLLMAGAALWLPPGPAQINNLVLPI